MGQVSGAGTSREDRLARWVQQTSRGQMPHPEPRHAATDRPSVRAAAERAPDTLSRGAGKSRASRGKARLERSAGARSEALDDLRTALRGYRRTGHISTKRDGGWDGGLIALAATGRLDPATVRAELRRAGVSEPKFRDAMFNALRSQVAGRVADAVKTAEATVAKLQRDPSPLITKLAAMNRAGREQALRTIGFDDEAARRIAADPKASRETLAKGLETLRGQLAATRQEATLGSLFDRHTPEMFRLFAPVTGKLEGRKGSYLAQVKQDGLARCKHAQKVDTALKTVLGVAATVAGGSLTTGVLLGAATGAGAAALSGAPDLLNARQNRDAARGAEGLGVAREGAVRDAEAEYRKARINYGKGTALGGAGGGLNGYLGAGAGGAIHEIDAPGAAVLAPLAADGANRASDY